MLRTSAALAILSTCVCAVSAKGQTTLYVDDDAPGVRDGSSWCNAYVFLQDALAAAAASGGTVTEIRVAQGIYRPDQGVGHVPGDREATFQLVNGVALRGGYAGCGADDPDARDFAVYEAVLSGDLNGDDVGHLYDPSRNENSYHVTTGSGTNRTAVVDGFKVTGGYAGGSLDGPEPPAYQIGAGMYNHWGSPTVTNCTFRMNRAVRGGGMYNHANSSPTLVNCIFSSDHATTAGGGMYNLYSRPTLVNCIFRSNYSQHASGGGMSNFSSNPTLVNCAFWDNRAADALGGGMHNDHNSSPELENCGFFGNYAREGGGMYNQLNSSPTLDNCIFTGNSAYLAGGGMVNDGSCHTILTNCTFAGNECVEGHYTSHAGGGMYNYSSHPVVTNCIFWGNTDQHGTGEESQIYIEPVRTLDINFSSVQGWTGNLYGQGNTGDDPSFVDPDGPDDIPGTIDDDLRLLPSSPCIDAADNSVVTAWADYAGNPRALDDPDTLDTGNGTPPITDMGAYEFVPPDCNDNGILDLDEVLAAPSLDDNNNGIPDVCEYDCNRNEVRDDWDIADETSEDCGGNGVPDECEPDDDQDGVINECDGCPVDSTKTAPGCCGCGFIEPDVDGDGYIECPPDADVQPDVPLCPDTCPGLDDADFGPCEADVIPTLSRWGLIVTGLLLMVAAKVHFGRRPARSRLPG